MLNKGKKDVLGVTFWVWVRSVLNLGQIITASFKQLLTILFNQEYLFLNEFLKICFCFKRTFTAVLVVTQAQRQNVSVLFNHLLNKK